MSVRYEEMTLVSGWSRCDTNTLNVDKSSVIDSAEAESANVYAWWVNWEKCYERHDLLCANAYVWWVNFEKCYERHLLWHLLW